VGLSSGAFTNYNNLGTNSEVYGCLYNWYAVFDGPLLAPEGWHIPSDAEWQTLIDYLGGNAVAGDKLKEAGITHWTTPNNATNESGFTARGGGICNDIYIFQNLYGNYWSSAESGANSAWVRRFTNNSAAVERVSLGKTVGMSVRCIKN
jgi:uncharacterized protein (TIGR02145 family)